ncbi:MAG: hypothetical protein RIQ51_1129 [Bacteroidota bacterium]|jgi:hypothetical protein
MLNKAILMGLFGLVGLVVGEQSAIYNIKNDCSYLEKFRIGKEVYSCKRTI